MRVVPIAAGAAGAALLLVALTVRPVLAQAAGQSTTPPPAAPAGTAEPAAGAPVRSAPAAPQASPMAATPRSTQPTGTAAPRQITVDEAVRLALEQNVNVQVQRISPQIQDENVAQARAYWVPNLTSDFFYNSADTPPNSFLSGNTGTLKTDQYQTSAGILQQLPWGGYYSVGWEGAHSNTNSVFSNFNPQLNSNMRLEIFQPLFRNFATDTARQQLLVSRKNREISDVQFRGIVVSTIRAVKSAYWDLKYALANLEVQRQSLELARQTLKDNRTRVEVGTMAPIDIVEAESEVARNEESVIVAEATIRQAEDQLRALIMDPSTPDFWTAPIEPVDAPQIQLQAVDLDAAVRAALNKRTDLQQARLQLENVAANQRYYRNQTLPQVNLQLNYSTTGLGGSQAVRDAGFPPGPILSTVDRSFATALGDVFGFKYPTWTAAVSLSYPIGRSVAQAAFARTQLELRQGELQIRNAELQAVTQIRDIGRQVNTNSKRVDATRAARVLAERRLEAEQKKFGVGMSTSFLVFQAQRDLATARVNELRAILDYNKSLADFEAVQETSVSGGGVSIAGSGGSTALGTSGSSTLGAGTGASSTSSVSASAASSNRQ